MKADLVEDLVEIAEPILGIIIGICIWAAKVALATYVVRWVWNS